MQNIISDYHYRTLNYDNMDDELKEYYAIREKHIIRGCPFCGADDWGTVVCFDNHENLSQPPRPLYQVTCNLCMAQGPADYDRLKAIKYWNEMSSHFAIPIMPFSTIKEL